MVSSRGVMSSFPEHLLASGRGILAPFISRAGGNVPQSVKVLLRPMVKRYLADAHEYRLACMDHPVGNRWTVKVGAREHKFFFVGGCYKSGTHWVSNLLNLHPKVNVTGEFNFEEMLQTFQRFTTRSWYRAAKADLRPVAIDAMENLVRRCMYAATRDKPEATWLGDHTPRHMREILPGAPRILVARDGRDVLVSFAFHLLRSKNPHELVKENAGLALVYCPQFRADPERFKNPSEGFLGNSDWVRRQARAWAEFMRHDRAEAARLRELGTPVLDVRYEDVHGDLEGQRAKMYRFLGLDASQAAPASAESKTIPGFKTENVTSFFRKGQVGDFKNYFDDRITRIFKEEAGDELVRMGYEQDLNW